MTKIEFARRDLPLFLGLFFDVSCGMGSTRGYRGLVSSQVLLRWVVLRRITLQTVVKVILSTSRAVYESDL